VTYINGARLEEILALADSPGRVVYPGEVTALAAEVERRRSAPVESVPVPMRLVCEGCGELHIDEGEFATKPHHTHACQHCGAVWRPAIVATVGVRFLPGFKNTEGK
jgi:hypothetical protein